jgi:hypothetical protein
MVTRQSRFGAGQNLAYPFAGVQDGKPARIFTWALRRACTSLRRQTMDTPTAPAPLC